MNRDHRPTLSITGALAVALLLSACGSPSPAPVAVSPATATAPAGPPQRGLALVQAVDVAAPAPGAERVSVTVRGQLGDACTTLADVSARRTGQTFLITVATERPAGAACAAVVSEFERTITLDVAGLPAGEYVVVANDRSQALTLASSAPPTPTVPPTATPAPTEPASAAPTSAPTSAPAPTTAPAAANLNCVDKAAFDSDVTVSDDTLMKQGQAFTKTWRVRNAGTCVWQGYSLTFYSGDSLGANTTVAIPVVQPGAYANISVDMTAPASGGVYIGNWAFQNTAGQRFGIAGSGYLWVKIAVSWVGGSAASTSGSASTSGAAGTPGAAPGAETSAVVTSGGCSVSGNDGYEAQVLTLINNARQQNGLAPLALNGQLTAAARLHSRDVACNGFASDPHRGSDGSSFYDRVRAQGYGNVRSARENMYMGPPEFGGTPGGAFNWWWNSQIHHDNILFPSVTQIGIAYAYSATSQYGGYYVVIFAAP